MSSGTQMTTPPSSNPSPFFPFQLPVIHQHLPLTIPHGLGFAGAFVAAANQLTYPSAPPPSLSSSLGAASPVASRRNSVGVSARPSIPSSPHINHSEPLPEEEAEELSMSYGRQSNGSGSTEGNIDDDDTFGDSMTSATSTVTSSRGGPSSRTTGRASPPPPTSSPARRTGFERGARVAETGSLAAGRRRNGNGRGRRGGTGVPSE